MRNAYPSLLITVNICITMFLTLYLTFIPVILCGRSQINESGYHLGKGITWISNVTGALPCVVMVIMKIMIRIMVIAMIKRH